MRTLVRTLAALALAVSVLAVTPNAAMASGRFIGGGVGECISFAVYGTGSPQVAKLLEIDVSNTCDLNFPFYVGVQDSNFAGATMAVPAGVTAEIRAPELLPTGIFLIEIAHIISGSTSDLNDPCDLNTDYIVQPDGSLAPRSSVCP